MNPDPIRIGKLRKNDFSSSMSVLQVALNKQAVSQMENDMERWLKEREKLSHKLEKLSQKKRRLLLGKKIFK
jgi:hypothetical protein